MRFVAKAAATAGVLVLLTTLAMPATAGAACPQYVKCGEGQTLARVETKECKATRLRPAVTISRACCQDRKGRVRCKAFKKCPRKSPSSTCR
jgi:hypothetical protein